MSIIKTKVEFDREIVTRVSEWNGPNPYYYDEETKKWYSKETHKEARVMTMNEFLEEAKREFKKEQREA